MAYSAITTGQFVQIQQKSATVADRLLALIIDLVLISGYITGGSYLLKEFRNELRGEYEVIIYFGLLVLIPLLYFLLFELFTNGQTVGKRIMRIRVIMKDSTPPTVGAYLLRWILLPIDAFLTGGIGALFIIFTKNSQRLGDLAAGTIVIKEQNFKHLQINLDEFGYLSPDYRPTYPQAAELSLEQVNIISRTLDANKKRHKRIELLANKICSTLHINRNTDDSYEEFLRNIIRAYQYFALKE